MGSKKLWCVAMRPEYDSPFKQSPAASKELAEQAVARYRKLHHRMFHSEVIANAYDEWFQVQQWHGTRKDHIRKMFYVQDWFNQPMFQIFDMSRAVDIFSREDIVICYKKGSAPIVTKDIEEARCFYEVL